MRHFAFTSRMLHAARQPQLLCRLPWLVTVLALWGLVQVPTALPLPNSERTSSERMGGERIGGNRALTGPSQPAKERDLRPHLKAPRVWRETPPPQPWPDLPLAPPQPVHLLVRQYAAAVETVAPSSACVRAARFGKWQLEGG